MENKNTIIAIALMLVVWVGFSIFFPPQPTAPPKGNDSTQPSSGHAPSVPSAPALSPAPSPVPPSPTVAGDERRIVVEHPLYRAVFTNIGARLLSFELKDYKVSPQAGAPSVNLVHGPEKFSTLVTSGSDGLNIPADAYYSVSSTDNTLRVEGGQGARLVFTTTLASGLTVEKIYSFHGEGYQFDLDITVRNGSSTGVKGSFNVALQDYRAADEEKSSYDFIGASTLVGAEVERLSLEDVEKKPVVYSGPLRWTAFGDKYFISAVVPQAESAAQIGISKEKDVVRNVIASPVRSFAAGESTTFHYLLYFGPRDLELLRAVGHDLGEAVDFGLFSIIARPLLHVLKFFHSFLGNYGLAIILLTVIIKLIFWPLTQKSYSSMKEMQKLQPEMQRIREKYGKDRDRLNREIMEMYKKHRVNPLGGCLPMLVQIPVFFALYKVLMEAIEVRHAPFYLWISDLSAKDPYYVTPLIMGATMFIQQKMTPTTMDPMQAKLFMLMPIIFTFMFLNFPSGLVIYWLVNNLLTIGQQYLINRRVT